MTKLNKILAGLLVVQLGLAAFVLTRSEQTSIGKLEAVLPPFDKAKLTRIRVFESAVPGAGDQSPPKDASKPTIDLVKQGTGWILASHFGYPVDGAKVDDLIGNLSGMKARGPLAENADRQKQLEVADDTFQRKVTLSIEGQGDVTVLIGASAGARKTAVRVAGKAPIYGASGITAYGIALQPKAWLDATYFEAGKDDVTGLTISNSHGSFELDKSGDDWQVAIDGKPAAPAVGEALDKAAIDALVGHAAKLVLVEPADPARSIAQPDATITVRVAKPPSSGDGATPAAASGPVAEHVFELVSEKDDRYYVRERGAPHAVLVEAASLRDLVDLGRDKLFSKPKADASGPPAGLSPEGPAGLPGGPGMMPGGPGMMPGGPPP